MAWGAMLSASARIDVETLASTGLAIAHDALHHAVNFDPVPLVITEAGEALQLRHDRSRLGRAAPELVAKHARELLAASGPRTRAVALVTVARLVRYKSDAIEIWIEHREGAALTVLQPFVRDPIGRPEYYEPRAFSASRFVWATA